MSGPDVQPAALQGVFMADAHWTSYVGMVTGIAGAVMGLLAYRRTTRIKALDLRLELRRAEGDLIATLEKLDKLIPYANQSRERVAAASGGLDSGAMVQWKLELDVDLKKLEDFKAQQPSKDANHSGLKPEELESKLVAVHRLQGLTNALKSKYESALAADDERRKEIRENTLFMQRGMR
jgi:hypothetical protein